MISVIFIYIHGKNKKINERHEKGGVFINFDENTAFLKIKRVNFSKKRETRLWGYVEHFFKRLELQKRENSMNFSRVSAHLKCNKQSWGKTINFIHKSVARFALANDRKRQGK
ncbi:MAG: hypothetical protein IKW37_05970, partial [Bacteroidaceae bacterium]|nr:hypothetical protein [Bacteroidaceae bacterium]